MGYIKIDQSFVKDRLVSRESLAIVHSTIDLVRDLGRQTVAEGVETREDWDQLAALGCNIGQGYFIAKPMPAEEFPGWVERFQPIVTRPPASLESGVWKGPQRLLLGVDQHGNGCQCATDWSALEHDRPQLDGSRRLRHQTRNSVHAVSAVPLDDGVVVLPPRHIGLRRLWLPDAGR